MSLRIVIADDHDTLRHDLRTFLEKQQGMEVIAEAADGESAIRIARELKPDVVIMDVTMPGINGIEATRQILSSCRGTKVLGLSIHSNKQFVREMLKAGASGYVLKDCASAELVGALQALAANHMYLGLQITDIVLADYLRHVRNNNSRHTSGLNTR